MIHDCRANLNTYKSSLSCYSVFAKRYLSTVPDFVSISIPCVSFICGDGDRSHEFCHDIVHNMRLQLLGIHCFLLPAFWSWNPQLAIHKLQTQLKLWVVVPKINAVTFNHTFFSESSENTKVIATILLVIHVVTRKQYATSGMYLTLASAGVFVARNRSTKNSQSTAELTSVSPI